jgi:hypothetical protein
MHQSTSVSFMVRIQCVTSFRNIFHQATLAVKGHGIPASAISGALTAAQSFFALPDSTKMKVRTLYFRDARLPLLKRRRDDLPSSISTRARISKGTRRCLEKTRIRRIAVTSTKVLIWAGKNLAQVLFGRRRRTALWLVKISGLMIPSSLVSAKQCSNISKSFCSYLTLRSHDKFIGQATQQCALGSICFLCSRSRSISLRTSSLIR